MFYRWLVFRLYSYCKIMYLVYKLCSPWLEEIKESIYTPPAPVYTTGPCFWCYWAIRYYCKHLWKSLENGNKPLVVILLLILLTTWHWSTLKHCGLSRNRERWFASKLSARMVTKNGPFMIIRLSRCILQNEGCFIWYCC